MRDPLSWLAESTAVSAAEVTAIPPRWSASSGGIGRRTNRNPFAGRRRVRVLTSMIWGTALGQAVNRAATASQSTASGTFKQTARTRVSTSPVEAGCTYTPGNNRARRPARHQRLRLDFRGRSLRASRIPSCAASSESRSITPGSISSRPLIRSANQAPWGKRAKTAARCGKRALARSQRPLAAILSQPRATPGRLGLRRASAAARRGRCRGRRSGNARRRCPSALDRRARN